jgi:hypothetical protein
LLLSFSLALQTIKMLLNAFLKDNGKDTYNRQAGFEVQHSRSKTLPKQCHAYSDATSAENTPLLHTPGNRY